MSGYSNPPYDHRITCSAHHLRRVNSNLLHNSYSLKSCLATTRMSYFLHHPWSLTLQMTSKFSCKYEFHALSFAMPPHLAHPTFKTPVSLPSSPTHWLSTTRSGVENLPTPGIRQGDLELTAFPHSLDNIRNTKMLNCPHPTSTFPGAKQPRTK